MSEVIIDVRGASKKFCSSLKRSLWYGLHDIGADVFGTSRNQQSLRKEEFWAVNNIDFKVSRGQCLGLIGRNGAGKTSLLRMLNGLIRPDKGRVEMRGSVGAMIALGAGIKPLLSGRENIYCMAALRGMSRRQAEEKAEEIISFADIGDFIDSPISSYSSGMRVRLSFAVASALDPDILLLDEVMAVGDAAFRDKCYHRIAELRRNSAVIFVSHSMEQIARICSEVLVLDRGNCVHYGDVESGIEAYERLNVAKSETAGFLSLHPPIESFSFAINDDIRSGEPASLFLDFTAARKISTFTIKVHFYNAKGAFAADAILKSQDAQFEISAGRNLIDLRLESVTLKSGTYLIAFNIVDETGDLIVWSYKLHKVSVSGAYPGASSDCQLRLVGSTQQ